MQSLNLDSNRRILLFVLALSTIASAVPVGTTEAQESCLVHPPHMIHWWPGDGDTTDLVGNADGVTINGAGYGVGLVDDSFQTDGINDHIDVGSPTDMNFGTDIDYSVDAWVNPEDFIPVDGSGTSIIMEKHLFGLGNAVTLLVTLNPTGNVSVSARDTQDDLIGIQSTQPIPVDAWTHVAMTVHRDGVMSLYLDGVLDGTVAMDTIDDVTNNAELTIGGPRAANASGFHNAMNGLIDEVGIYNRELCPHEVKAIFDASADGMCKMPVAAIYADNFECGDSRVWTTTVP